MTGFTSIVVAAEVAPEAPELGVSCIVLAPTVALVATPIATAVPSTTVSAPLHPMDRGTT